MAKVTWSFYGRVAGEKVFDTYAAAKSFFYWKMKQRGVTKSELIVLS